MKRRGWFARNALGLWFLGISMLGLLRFWMKWREAGASPLPVDAWLWLAGGAACAIVAVPVLWRSLRRGD